MRWTLPFVHRRADRLREQVEFWWTREIADLERAVKEAGPWRGPQEWLAPLYLSSICASNCSECPWRRSNPIPRHTLTLDEARAEVLHIKERGGYTHIYCLTGSWNAGSLLKRGSMTEVNARGLRAVYEAGLIPVLESSPFNTAQLEQLFEVAGRRGAHVLHQETYLPDEYERLYGGDRFKGDPDARLQQQQSALDAGWSELGIGALLGLTPHVLREITCVLAHYQLLMEAGAQRVAISVPRLCPGTGTDVHGYCSDDEFVRAVLILRLLAPRAVLVLTARESRLMRDRFFLVTDRWGSRGSTVPGGYTLRRSSSTLQVAGQFDLADNQRSIQQILHDNR